MLINEDVENPQSKMILFINLLVLFFSVWKNLQG